MTHDYTDPAGIEAESMRRITEELARRKIRLPGEEMDVVLRVIHTTADFDFAKTLVFHNEAIARGRAALLHHKAVITDTNMALAGISKPSCRRFGTDARCFMADSGIVARAKALGTTRAYAAMGYAAEHFPDAVYAIGNAPTALFRLAELIRESSLAPALVIAVPVGFVNVVEAKEQILEACDKRTIPVIASLGRKGGSTVCAAIVNALFYGIQDEPQDEP